MRVADCLFLFFAVPCLSAACGGGSSKADAGSEADSGADAAGPAPDARSDDALPGDAGFELAGDVAPVDVVAGKLGRLRAEGTSIVDPAGNVVQLRGVNLGGWMFHETWITLVDYASHGRVIQVAEKQGVLEAAIETMQEVGLSYGTDPAVPRVCPGNGEEWLDGLLPGLTERLGEEKAVALLDEVKQYPALCDDADQKLRSVLEERFGTDGRDELLDSFQQGWLTEKDIEWLASQGFNLVRVPIGYRSLMTGPDSDKPEKLSWNEKALQRIDALLDWCAAHGVYAVIDIQEAPGGQNTYAGTTGLYGDAKMEALTVEMWETLSDRFKDRDEVAAYSLLAEPYGAPDTAARDAMYDKLVKAVRARGDDHLMVIHDGFFGMMTLPVPAEMGWDGIVYSTHLFEWKVTGLDGYQLMLDIYTDTFGKAQAKHKVPYYIGSFSTFKDEDWAYQAVDKLVAWMNGNGYSWSVWTYKRPDDPLTQQYFGYSTSWGVRGRLETAFDRPDPWLDSKETLAQKFLGYGDLDVKVNEKLLSALLGAAR